MAEAASNKQLKSAFQEHLRETEQHVTRLEKVFSVMGVNAQRDTCEAMKGLIGTVAGDDTILAVAASAAAGKSLARALRTMSGIP